ncbi:hypothetical protein WN55_06076 [Dufourea novaeangliae]|uniref:Uncharacterized protein n=1 Tax=Dufourea novaeangliae TaxID=178035 RepID=A0A154P241_DUFNO|nr:hypothetical protein WN55_06076 [Dufourea novaeangliae]
MESSENGKINGSMLCRGNLLYISFDLDNPTAMTISVAQACETKEKIRTWIEKGERNYTDIIVRSSAKV